MHTRENNLKDRTQAATGEFEHVFICVWHLMWAEKRTDQVVNLRRILKNYTNYCLKRHAFYFLWLLLSFQPVYVFAQMDIVLCGLFN
jgi:hypothetical protein